MMEELGPEARSLIERARHEERPPNAEVLARIRSHVTLGVASTVLLGAGEAVALAGKTSVFSLLGVAVKGGLLGTAVALAGHTIERATNAPEPPPAALHAVANTGAPSAPAPHRYGPSAPALEAKPAEHEPGAAPVASVSALPHAPAPRREPRAPSLPASGATATVGSLGAAASLPVSAELAEELSNLRRVQEALRAGHGAEALRLLDTSSPRLDQGQLRQERLAAEVFAACQSGQLERARQAARRFLEENPATPSAARLQSSCVGPELGR
jgi:hypothetical protein